MFEWFEIVRSLEDWLAFLDDKIVWVAGFVTAPREQEGQPIRKQGHTRSSPTAQFP